MAEFEAGSKVSYRGMAMPAEILSGPHRSPGKSRYLIQKADGNVSLVSAADLTRVIPRLDQVAESLAVIMAGVSFKALPYAARTRVTLAATRALSIADETRGQ